jgi:hypothetical protein
MRSADDSQNRDSALLPGQLFNYKRARQRFANLSCGPHRPQTNGKVIERFNRTLMEEWAYARIYLREGDRARALARWFDRCTAIIDRTAHSEVGRPSAALPTAPTNTPRGCCKRGALAAARPGGEPNRLPCGSPKTKSGAAKVVTEKRGGQGRHGRAWPPARRHQRWPGRLRLLCPRWRGSATRIVAQSLLEPRTERVRAEPVSDSRSAAHRRLTPAGRRSGSSRGCEAGHTSTAIVLDRYGHVPKPRRQDHLTSAPDDMASAAVAPPDAAIRRLKPR